MELTMPLPQAGIFALGTLAHAYLEFDLAPGAEPVTMVAAAAGVSEPRTTMGGVNLVIGIGPELWAAVAPAQVPRDAAGFEAPVVGRDGYTMPATQHDLVMWVAGASYDVVFDVSLALVDALSGTAVLVDETVGWSYHRDLDLTGFIDGTENPSLSTAPSMVLIPDGAPGAGGTVLLLQKWEHDAASWMGLPDADQERVIGRTKLDSIELDDRPTTSHAARTDQDQFGHIFRRNTPYGSVLNHGTMFVGFSPARQPLHAMLESMAGVTGERDALTRYARPLTGAYYFVPALDDLAKISIATEA
jgi:putative iron-dependent peroxidase